MGGMVKLLLTDTPWILARPQRNGYANQAEKLPPVSGP